MLAKDVLYSTRESILIYSITAMLVLAVGTLFFLPSLERMDVRIAVDSSVPVEVRQKIGSYAHVEHYDTHEKLRERVLGFDDVPGIYVRDGAYVLLLEGNEDSHMQSLPALILDAILNEEQPVTFSAISLNRQRSPVREYTTIFFLMSMFLVGGMFIGLSVVDDKQSQTIRALAVTPVNVFEYVSAKSALGLLTVLVTTFAVATILLGPSGINYMQLMVWVLCSLGFAVLIGFVIGLTSQSLLTAIAIVKATALVITGVTMGSILLPEHLKWILYVFPNYWSVEGLNRILIQPQKPLAPVNLVTAVFSFGLLLALVSRFGRQLRLTVGGGE